jgi:hypothetical protein
MTHPGVLDVVLQEDLFRGKKGGREMGEKEGGREIGREGG